MCNSKGGNLDKHSGDGSAVKTTGRHQPRSRGRIFFGPRRRAVDVDDQSPSARSGCDACRYRGLCSGILQQGAEMTPNASASAAADEQSDGRAN
jgi:hypothetical protein